jgi:hypothetical protein
VQGFKTALRTPPHYRGGRIVGGLAFSAHFLRATAMIAFNTSPYVIFKPASPLNYSFKLTSVYGRLVILFSAVGGKADFYSLYFDAPLLQ